MVMKVIKTILVSPFALIGGIMLGVLSALFYLVCAPIEIVSTIICDIWEGD